MLPQSLHRSSSCFLSLLGHLFFPCRFLCCSCLSCLFFPIIIPVIHFPFVTSSLTSFLPFVFLLVTYTYLLSCPIVPPSFSAVIFSPATFLNIMFNVVLSQFVFSSHHPPPVTVLSALFFSLYCSFRPPSVIALYSIPFFGHYHLNLRQNISLLSYLCC